MTSHTDLDPATTSRVRVALVFGGRSTEHAVSCATAASVLRAIDRDRYDVVPVGITPAGQWVLVEDDPAALDIKDRQLPQVADNGAHILVPMGGVDRTWRVRRGDQWQDLGEIDVAFPLLHGPFGEDGTIQGLFEMADVKYVGCGVLASAAMMDKHVMKVLFASAGLPLGPFEVITPAQWQRDEAAALARIAQLGFPVFVKPARAGSSMGITRVDDAQSLPAAIRVAHQHDPKVVVEAGIQGRELECGVLQSPEAARPRVSEIGEINVVAGHDFYDFEAKYLDAENVELACPTALPRAAREDMQRIAAAAFEVAGGEGLARVDCFYTAQGEVLINEINTMPGFTPWSMYPAVWAASGIAYPTLIDELIGLAMHRSLGLR